MSIKLLVVTLTQAVASLMFLTAPTFATDALQTVADRNVACKLLTSAQVSTALGTEVGAGAEVGPGAKNSCAWREIGKEAGPPYVQVQLLDEKEFERIKALRDVAPKHESNIGDDAYFARSLVNGYSLVVKLGQTYFSVYAKLFDRAPKVGEDDEKCKQVERTIALKITGQN